MHLPVGMQILQKGLAQLVRQPVNTPANGVTDTVLGTIDLAKESIKAERPLQRVRKLVVAPGGVVPWHSHDDRSALIYDSEGGSTNTMESISSISVARRGVWDFL